MQQSKKHLRLLWSWVAYFILFFLTENLIPPEDCYVVWCPLDALIPFCEWFLIPYVGWYGLIVFSLWYFHRHDVTSFKRLQIYIMVTQAVAMVCYILLPSRQDLRPTAFDRDNILIRGTQLLYALDTNTGVCPSLHVAYSLGIASVWLRREESARYTKWLVLSAVVLICLSTMFMKQHSALDVLAALLLGLLAEFVVWRTEKAENTA